MAQGALEKNEPTGCGGARSRTLRQAKNWTVLPLRRGNQSGQTTQVPNQQDCARHVQYQSQQVYGAILAVEKKCGKLPTALVSIRGVPGSRDGMHREKIN